MKISIVTINTPSLNASKELIKYLSEYELEVYNKEIQDNIFKKYEKLDDILEIIWNSAGAIIFLIATGIVVRKIAPLLNSKDSDPAILVMSFDLKQVIPLVSGHLGGANFLSNELSQKINGCVSFITTATDQTKTFAFDNFAKENSFEILNLNSLAKVSNLLLNKKKVNVISYEAIFDLIKKDKFFSEDFFNFYSFNNSFKKDENLESVYISPQNFSLKNLIIQIPNIYLGLGMNRGVSLVEVEEAINLFCLEHNLKFSQIKNIASFKAKSDEVGLLEFAKKYNFDIKFFDESEINNLERNFSKSEATKFFNIKGVAEPSAILVSYYKELFLNKRVYNNITISGAI